MRIRRFNESDRNEYEEAVFDVFVDLRDEYTEYSFKFKHTDVVTRVKISREIDKLPDSINIDTEENFNKYLNSIERDVSLNKRIKEGCEMVMASNEFKSFSFTKTNANTYSVMFHNVDRKGNLKVSDFILYDDNNISVIGKVFREYIENKYGVKLSEDPYTNQDMNGIYTLGIVMNRVGVSIELVKKITEDEIIYTKMPDPFEVGDEEMYMIEDSDWDIYDGPKIFVQFNFANNLNVKLI
jgi:hypothetical protein